MKKVYIILTLTIYKAAGSQIYTKNKVNFMKERGWDVFVYSSNNNANLMIKEFSIFEDLILPDLTIPPHLLSKKKRISVLDLFRTTCENGEEVIIESHTKTLALWGELIASKYKCKHIAYLLTETYGNPSKNVLDFLNFKHKRKELAGISNRSLGLLFEGYKKINEEEKYSLKAVCTNSVEDVKNEIIDNIQKKDISIGSIGRLDKPYVPKMIDEIVKYANNNSNLKIQLILVGDSRDGNIEKDIINKTQHIKNLYIVITGRLFPIPKSLFSKVDVFIGVAGAARISADLGIPTISIDTRNAKPIGVLGYETSSALFSESNNDMVLSVKIEEVLKNYDQYNEESIDRALINVKDYRDEFVNHLSFIESSNKEKSYYNVIFKILKIEEMLYMFILLIFGSDFVSRLVKCRWISKIRKILRWA